MKRMCLIMLLLALSLSGYAAEPLPAAQVFTPMVSVVDPNAIQLVIDIKPGYFLYRDRFKFGLAQATYANLGTMSLPQNTTKQNKTGTIDKIYRDKLKLIIPILGLKAGTTKLSVHYQGCADSGFCYPPVESTLKLTINSKLAITAASLITATPTTQNLELSSSDEAANILSQDSLLLVILSFYGFGLLLAFTPCVLPMVPVLSGMIVGHGQHLGSRKAFLLSLIYVLSMALAYAIVGVIIAVIGANMQLELQNAWVVCIFALMFILLALSMFGFYDLTLPVSWQSKFSKISRSQHGGAYLGVALMGALSTLILSPCVTAPLVGALSYIADTGDILLGAVALFTLGLGMGTPLLMLGASAGKLLPKAGIWMNAVKAFFGVLLLAMAIYVLSRILPAIITMLLWSTLLIISSIYLGALTRNHESNWGKLWQGCGIMLLLYGSMIAVGASMGHSDPLQPLTTLNANSSVNSPILFNRSIQYHQVTTVQKALHALARAQLQQRPVMLDFYASWCSSCVWMEHTTFTDPRVIHLLTKYSVVRADITANDQASQQLLKYFNVIAPPTFIFYDNSGNEISSARIVGKQTAMQFSQQLQKLEK